MSLRPTAGRLVFIVYAGACGGNVQLGASGDGGSALGGDGGVRPDATTFRATDAEAAGRDGATRRVVTDARAGRRDGATGRVVTDSGQASSACVPGQSVACVGPGGCATNQVCNSSGSVFGPCACSSSADASTTRCIPGQSIACAGKGGCVSSQVCNAAGSGYGACDCGDDGGTLACVPGQSISCGGAQGCASHQICNEAGSAYGPCDCPDGGSSITDAGELPDGYAPIPASLGTQGYNAIWAVNPLEVPSQGWIFRPLFSVPDCAAVPPYGDSYVAVFEPTSAGPSGEFPVCDQSGGGPMPCYDTQIYTYLSGNSSFQTVPGGKFVLSDFNADGIATGQMDTLQGIVPLTVKNCL